MRTEIPGKQAIQIIPSGGMSVGVPGGSVIDINKHGGVNLPPPLYISGAATWPISDGLLGVGAGWALLDAGTWSGNGTYVLNTLVAGVNQVVNSDCELDSNWNSFQTPETNERYNAAPENVYAGTYSRHIVDSTGSFAGAQSDAYTRTHKWRSISAQVKVISGSAIRLYLVANNGNQGGTPGSIAVGDWTLSKIVTRDDTAGSFARVHIINAGAGTSEFYFDEVYDYPLPISTLITNVQLSTTDVLAEEVIHAFTLRSQVGLAQSDRPFAFPANADAAAGQKVIVLKNLTHTVPDTDTLTIIHPIAGGTIYTIASVSAMADGVQTITLDVNLMEAVSEDDMVGVDWSSWNGSLTYFDGLGNIKLDEIKAGVYTNRGSTAKAFAADKVFSVEKTSSTYQVKFDGVDVGAAINTVAAEAMAGDYWGMFNTLLANQITYLKIT
jgi:hypothetical protein